MRIVIQTDGSSENSVISINGEKQELIEFSFALKGGGQPKLRMVRKDGAKNTPISMFGNDFSFYDEYSPDKSGTKE